MSDTADKVVLISVSAVIDFAESLPLAMLVQQNSEPHYPDTVGEMLVSHALGLVLAHTWTDATNEAAVGALQEHLNLLDTGVGRPSAWKKLFRANIQLHDHIVAVSTVTE